MANQYTSYWLYQKYEKRGSQEAIPVYPNVYSVDGDGTMSKVIMIENDAACGYVPTGTTQYRWVNLDPSVDYYCDECPTPQYRWTNSGTTCVGYDKYQRAIKQVSYDNGQTWENVSPAEYSATTLIEADSPDCGYVEPIYRWIKSDDTICIGESFQGKLYAKYNDGQTYSAECDSSTTLTSATTKPSGYPYTAMTSAEIGDCITSIGDYAFGHYYSLSACTSLSSVTIGSGVTKIGRNAFCWCSGLTSVVIPSGVTSVGYQVFAACSSLTSVTIGNGVTFIDIQAFQGCSSLTSINIPSGVTEIAARAFEGCSSLTGITIPNNSQLTSISSWAFQRCSSLQSINIPSGVTGIGGYAFYGCTSLTSVTVNATTPPTLGEDAFYDTNDCAIYVPASSVEAYKAATNWSNYASRIQAIS